MLLGAENAVADTGKAGNREDLTRCFSAGTNSLGS
jgi:hypothetical protein